MPAPEVLARAAREQTVKFTEYRLIQDGLQVAAVDGPAPHAWREINHYAAVYSQDGPVRIEVKTDRGWKPVE